MARVERAGSRGRTTDPRDPDDPDDPPDAGDVADPAELADAAELATGEPPPPSSARAVLAHRVFRRVYFGAFLSNIGSWMQNVVLGALAYDLTGSSTFVGVVTFAQLGPNLVLSMVGGVLADRLDRRRLLVGVNSWQLVLSLVLTALVIPDEPNRVALILVVAGIGSAQAIFMPTYTSLLPQLVDRRHLAGAVSLNAAQMNASRVVGPVLGALVDSQVGAAPVFAANAVSYLFVIGAVLSVRLPAPHHGGRGRPGIGALGDGLRVVRGDPIMRRCLVTIFTLSLVSLPFIGQFPVLAERNLGVDERSATYGVLYAFFGVGAVLGALSVGTVLRHRTKAQIARVTAATFSAGLATLALLPGPAPAFPVLLVTGFSYIAMVTSLMTVLQERTGDHTRGRVMALWIMGWAGMVPVGNLVAGPLIEATSVTTVLLVGAAWAAVLAAYVRIDPRAGSPDQPGTRAWRSRWSSSSRRRTSEARVGSSPKARSTSTSVASPVTIE